MNTLLKILLTAVAVVVLAKILPGVAVEGYLSAIIVAIVIALLRFIVKPILIVLTLPVTILTLGLFLLIIVRAILIDYLCNYNSNGRLVCERFCCFKHLVGSVI